MTTATLLNEAVDAVARLLYTQENPTPADWGAIADEALAPYRQQASTTLAAARTQPADTTVCAQTIETLDELNDVLTGGGSAFLFRRAGDLVLAWQGEDGDLVGIRPWSEDDGPFDKVPPAVRETLAFALYDLDETDDEAPRQLRVPLTLVWQDGLASMPTVGQVRHELARDLAAKADSAGQLVLYAADILDCLVMDTPEDQELNGKAVGLLRRSGQSIHDWVRRFSAPQMKADDRA